MYCQNCGSKVDDNTYVCSFCGYSIEKVNDIAQKDRQIQELKEKVNQLEQTFSNTTTGENTSIFNNKMMFLVIFVLPIAFVVFFFVLFFILVNT
ncbi:MAG: zinc-ribbon domain-containing protein [Candidatus Lokiarchaeota archaeon]|jgi:uncharacterized membrane protein YvbJ